MEGISDELVSKARKASDGLLPEKSRALYMKEYEVFTEWKTANSVAAVDETVMLAYFQELSEKFTPNSLWTKYSMLKATLSIKENLDISSFNRLLKFLKQKDRGYVPKKHQVLTGDQIEMFIKDAPDKQYLLHKVVLIMGVFGGLRIDELVNMRMADIQDKGSFLLVSIPKPRPAETKSFTIVEDELGHLNLVRKYIALRPSAMKSGRFFLNYRNNKCILQPVGKNTLGTVPAAIAKYLKLENPKDYTGHCLRRTSSTLLVEGGGTIEIVKRHGRGSIATKNKIARMIWSSVTTSTPHRSLNSTATMIQGTTVNQQDLQSTSVLQESSMAHMDGNSDSTAQQRKMMNVHGSEIYYTEAVRCKESMEQKAFLLSDKRTHVSVPLLPLVAASPVVRVAAEGHCYCQEVCISVPDFSHQTLQLLSDFVSGKEITGTLNDMTCLKNLCCVLGINHGILQAPVETNDGFVPVPMSEFCLQDMVREDCPSEDSLGLEETSDQEDMLEQSGKAVDSMGIFDGMAPEADNAWSDVCTSTIMPEMIKQEDCSETSPCSFRGDMIESSASCDMFEQSGTSGIGIFMGTTPEKGNNTQGDVIELKVAESCKSSEQEIMEVDTDDEHNTDEIQEEGEESTKKATSCVLPEKSVELYERQYQCFTNWRIEKNMGDAVTEDVLLHYFKEKANVYKASSLVAHYSMLKATLKIRGNVDISQFRKLLNFLKQQSAAYTPKKPKTLNREDINKFMLTAPDDEYLFIKVALIIGIAGSCRRKELCNLRIDDVEDKDSLIVVTIPDTSTPKRRRVAIFKEDDDVVDPLVLCRKYLRLRPKTVEHRRLFVNYRNGKCSVQPVGINSFGRISQKIAEFLGLENPKLYTGYCVHKSSVSLL